MTAIIEAFRNTQIPIFAAIAALTIRIAASVLWFWGLADYSQSKGYSRWKAAWGVIPCPGLLVLVLMRDQWVNDETVADDPNSNYPR